MSPYTTGGGKVIDMNANPILKLLGLGVIVLVLIILLLSAITRVESGHVGVLTLFGRVTGEVLPEGMHLINPFKTNNEMSIRTQEIKESASVPSSEGLVMNLDTSLIFHLDSTKAADVFQKIGPNYVDVLIEPNLRAAIRESTASHTANALYTGEREMVAKQIDDQLEGKLGSRGLVVEAILLRDIQLPATLKTSIEAKQQAARVWMSRPSKQVVLRRQFDQGSGVHHGDPVGNVRHHRQIMRNVQHGETKLGAQFSEQFENLRLNGDVEGGSGLIGNQ